MPAAPFLPVSRRVRRVTAAAVWTVVGVGLAAAGSTWVVAARTGHPVGWLAVAAAAGWVKGMVVLRPRARANDRRIAASDDRRPLVEIFSIPAWLLVGGMMGAGYALRHAGLPLAILGGLYAAIGVALLTGASSSWIALAGPRGDERKAAGKETS